MASNKIAGLAGVREYAEGMEVTLDITKKSEWKGSCDHTPPGRLIISASNEGGYNGTEVDLLDLLTWLDKHRDLLTAEVIALLKHSGD